MLFSVGDTVVVKTDFEIQLMDEPQHIIKSLLGLASEVKRDQIFFIKHIDVPVCTVANNTTERIISMDLLKKIRNPYQYPEEYKIGKGSWHWDRFSGKLIHNPSDLSKFNVVDPRVCIDKVYRDGGADLATQLPDSRTIRPTMHQYFKIGDVVRLKNPDMFGYKIEADRGIVVEIKVDDQDNKVWIKLEQLCGVNGWWYEALLQKVTTTIKIGDWVKFLPSQQIAIETYGEGPFQVIKIEDNLITLQIDGQTTECFSSVLKVVPAPSVALRTNEQLLGFQVNEELTQVDHQAVVVPPILGREGQWVLYDNANDALQVNEEKPKSNKFVRILKNAFGKIRGTLGV